MAKTSKIVQARRYKLKARHTTKVYNRCRICGRPRGYMRKFGMCRICFRKLAHEGEIPGVRKLIW